MVWNLWLCAVIVFFQSPGSIPVHKIGFTLADACILRFGVLQGSVLGPLFFSIYTTPLSNAIGKHKGIRFHVYKASNINLTDKNATSVMDRLNSCLHDVKNWMNSNKHKLNADKTEFIVFGSKRQRDLAVIFPCGYSSQPPSPS